MLLSSLAYINVLATFACVQTLVLSMYSYHETHIYQYPLGLSRVFESTETRLRRNKMLQVLLYRRYKDPGGVPHRRVFSAPTT